MEIIIIIGSFVFGFIVLGNIYEKWSDKRSLNKSLIIDEDFNFNANNKSKYSGGDGTNEQNAIVINATSSILGIPLEYEYIEGKYGRKDFDWEMTQQYQYDNNTKYFDVMEIKLKDGSNTTIYFNITNFYGKF